MYPNLCLYMFKDSSPPTVLLSSYSFNVDTSISYINPQPGSIITYSKNQGQTDELKIPRSIVRDNSDLNVRDLEPKK